MLLSLLLAWSAHADTAKCFKADRVVVWEKRYCFATTGADDEPSEVFQACFKKVKKDRAIPRGRCARVKWLKERACSDDPYSGNTKVSCLTDPDFLRKVEENPTYTGS